MTFQIVTHMLIINEVIFFEENGGLTVFMSELQKWLKKENRIE